MEMVLGWLAVIGGFLILRIIVKLVQVKRIKKVGFAYVHVNEDRSLRRLTGKEKKYLSQQFDPEKDDLPNIKYKFRALGNDGTQAGFIHVKKVPLWMKVP